MMLECRMSLLTLAHLTVADHPVVLLVEHLAELLLVLLRVLLLDLLPGIVLLGVALLAEHLAVLILEVKADQLLVALAALLQVAAANLLADLLLVQQVVPNL